MCSIYDNLRGKEKGGIDLTSKMMTMVSIHKKPHKVNRFRSFAVLQII